MPVSEVLNLHHRPRFVDSITFDPPSIAANATGDVSVSVPGAKTDMCFALPSIELDAGLVLSHIFCDTDGTVKIRLANVTGDAINQGSITTTLVAF